CFLFDLFMFYLFFFFSSRRRHTRSKRDWSSDVCSSDLLFLAACGGSKADLVVTSFTDELQDVIDVFEEKHDVTVDLQIIPTEDYTTTLQPALESGEGAPDVFTGEIVYLKKSVEQDY